MKKLSLIISFLYFVSLANSQTFTSTPNATINGGGTNTYGGGGGFTCLPFNISGVGTINGNKGLSSVKVNISNGDNTLSEIVLKLIAPDGTQVLLFNDNSANYLGGPITGSFVNTVFTEASTTVISSTTGSTGNFQPVDMLGVVNNGQNADGVWSLCVFDVISGDAATVSSWSLTFDNTAVVQTLPQCSSNPTHATDTCYNAPYICNFNGFCGQTSSNWHQSTWPRLTTAFCGGIDNNSFIKFIAGATRATFNVWVYNDSYNGEGIQMLFFNDVCGYDNSGQQTTNPRVVTHGCINPITSTQRTPTLITATGLVVGTTYFLMFDGFNGDISNYTIEPVSGVNALSLSVVPDSLTICQGTSLNLSASGGIIQSYTWSTTYKPTGLNNTTGSNVTFNSTAGVAGFPLLTKTITDTITVQVQSIGGGCKDTASIQVTVLPQPTINIPTPSYQSGPLNYTPKPLNITPLATGNNYQWYSNTVPKNYGGTLIPGQTGGTYTPPTSTLGTLYYYCVSSNGICNTATSIVDTVIVNNNCELLNTPPSLSPINACQNVTLAQPLSVTATYATGYQWYQNTTQSNTGGTLIPGATSSTFIPPTTAVGTTYYYCVISGACNPSITSAASGAVNILPASINVPAITAASNQICVGGTIQLNNSLGGGSWTSDNTSVATVDVSTGAVTGLSLGTANITYTVSGFCGSSASPQFPVTVLTTPNPGTITGAQPVCSGSNSITLTLNPPAVGNVIWQSSTDNINYTTIAGQTSQTYTATNLNVPTYYQVIVSNGVCPNVKSGFVLVQVNPKPIAGTISGASPVCSGKNSTTLTLTGSTGSIVWYASTDGINYSPIAGQTSTTYNPTNLSTTTYYEAVVSNGGGGCVADTAKTSIVVNPATPVTIALSATNTSICKGKTAKFTANTTNQGSTPTYQWQKNGVNVGSNSPTYTDSTLSSTDKIVCILTSSASCVSPIVDTSAPISVLVLDSTTSSTQKTICSGSLPYIWNGNSYIASGSYTVHLTNSNGCDSAATLVLSVASPAATTVNATICTGSSYIFNGTTYTQAGTYPAKLKTSFGCDSIVTLNLSVSSYAISNAAIKACNSYVWNGKTYTQSANVSDTFPKASVGGCDSIANLNLTITHPTSSINNVVNCGPYLWNGVTYTQSGSYNKVFPGGNANGCDSTANLNLTINNPSFSYDTVATCSSYLWNGTTYSTSGDYFFTIPGGNNKGCDSTAKLHLTINQPTSSITNKAICTSALPYLWNGDTLTTTGVYTAHFKNTTGCDSLATLNLTVDSTLSTITKASICAGTSYVFNGINISTAGTYTNHFTASNGCDSSSTLILTVNNPATTTINATICTGTSYTFNGTTYTQAGTYTAKLQTTKGCDSTVTLNLAVSSVAISNTNFNTCGSYVWNGKTYTKSGNYSDTFPKASVGGCDSVANLSLTINNPTTSTTSISACGSYLWNGVTYTQSGTYSKPFIGGSATGCDSTAFLNLTINNPTFSADTVKACSSYLWNGTTYTSSGDYSFKITGGSSTGCDSTANLHLLIGVPTTSLDTVTTCSSYIWNGTTYTSGGDFTKVFSGGNYKGCDSTAKLHLTINIPDTSILNITSCGQYTWNGVTYTQSGTYTKTITGGNYKHCDSIASLVLTVNSPSTSTTNATICNGQSYSFNGQSFSNAGSYTVHLTNNAGCDSAATLQLIVNTPTSNVITSSICNGNSYILNGTTYSTAGSYTQHLTNAKGCDSVLNLVLTVNQQSTSSTSVTVCSASLPYIWNGIPYNTSGSYVTHLTNAKGCDSAATLALNINQTTTSTTPVSICRSALPYIWNGNSYTATGNYPVHLTNSKNCDSTATLALTVNDATSSTKTDSFCNGSSYLYYGVAYTIPGTYYSPHFTNSAGCDSIQKLVLKLKPNIQPSFAPIAFCKGEKAPNLPLTSSEGIIGTWSPATIDSTQTSTYAFTPATGQCAQPTQLEVTVNSKPTVTPIVTGYAEVDVNQSITLTNSTPGGTWTVTPIDVATIDANGLFMALTPGVATVTYTVPNLVNPCGDGLTDLSITVISPNVYIPNIFSPNGDGHNDVFFIRGNKFTTKSVELSVYSQWGAQLFHSTGSVEDPTIGWDGNYSGKVQPTGVYNYIAKVTFNNGQTITKKGSISLIR